MNEFYNLNTDEVTSALDGISVLIQLKTIERRLGSIKHLKDIYSYIPTVRDYDYESYNCIETSEIGKLLLDAIFEDGYEILDVMSDFNDAESSASEIEDTIYFFNLAKSDMPKYKEMEDEGCYPQILSLKSDAVKKAILIAEKELEEGNKAVTNDLVNIASGATINDGIFPEQAAIDFESGELNILYNQWSMYEIEIASEQLLDIEVYCREVVKEYGKNIN